MNALALATLDTFLDRVTNTDALTLLRSLPSQSVNTIVTSPPYFGLRDYGVDGQIGLEETPQEFIAKLVEIFGEAWRVLRDDGTLWVNIGDSYTGSGRGWQGENGTGIIKHEKRQGFRSQKPNTYGLPAKSLIGIPWRLAFALQDDGWVLRSDIIWNKPNPMPESVTDRPTKAHENIFLFAKRGEYYFDQDAVRQPHIYAHDKRNDGKRHTYSDTSKHNQKDPNRQRTKTDAVSFHPNGRNIRTVWTVSTEPYSEAHFATYPTRLIEPCIKAGCPVGGVVLDPFMGAGTTGLVAKRLGRHYVGSELNPEYAAMAQRRIDNEDPTKTFVLPTGEKQLSLFEVTV